MKTYLFIYLFIYPLTLRRKLRSLKQCVDSSKVINIAYILTDFEGCDFCRSCLYIDARNMFYFELF